MGWPRILEGGNEGNPVVCGGVVTSQYHQSVVQRCLMLNMGREHNSYAWTGVYDLPWPLAYSGMNELLLKVEWVEPSHNCISGHDFDPYWGLIFAGGFDGAVS